MSRSITVSPIGSSDYEFYSDPELRVELPRVSTPKATLTQVGKQGSTLHDRDAFIYGGALTLDVECYVADRVALLANLRERCLWGGDTRKFHTQFGIGVKFIIG